MIANIPDGSPGLHILPTQCELPANITLDRQQEWRSHLRVFPNPSPGRTTIHFQTSEPGLAQAGIFDPAGRLVRRLSDWIVEGGGHDLLWDGRDDEGRRVAAGVYLVRMSAAGHTRTTRMLIVR